MHAHHREQRLILVADRLDAARLIQLQLLTCLAQSCLVLCGCEDGYVEELA
jgi:hypothetical protein